MERELEEVGSSKEEVAEFELVERRNKLSIVPIRLNSPE